MKNFNTFNVYGGSRRLVLHSLQSDEGSFLRSPGLRSAVCGLQSDSRGFTLIELMVAMGILMIIVLMLANIFQQSTRAWDAGMRQTEIGIEARSAVNMIQRELSEAIYTNGGWWVVNDAGGFDSVTPWDGTVFGPPARIEDDLFEITTTQTSDSRVSNVRVFSLGRAADSPNIRLDEVVDTGMQ